MTIGECIRTARQTAGLTQKELGQRLGISYQTVAQWENGLRNPKFSTLQKISTALDVNVLTLIPEKATSPHPFWTVDLQDKLNSVGCSIGCDEADAYVWISYPDGTLEVTEQELEDLNASIDSFVRFKLAELRQKREADFKPFSRRKRPTVPQEDPIGDRIGERVDRRDT